MIDKKQAAFARRYADRNNITLRTTSESTDTGLQLQVNSLQSSFINLEIYAKTTNNSLSTLYGIVQNLEGYVTLPQGKLAGRWSSEGTGYQQPVSIGYGLKLSNSGELSALTSQVADASLSILAGNGLLGGGDLTQNRTLSINFAANGEVSSSKAVRADDSRLNNIPSTGGLFDIDGGDSGVYTGNPILDGGGA